MKRTPLSKVRTRQQIGRNNKRKGSRNELRARKILEKAGYDVVKAGGSLGTFDLVAWNTTGMRLVQVKSNYCPPHERELINEYYNAPGNTSKELWIFVDRVRDPIIKVAPLT